MCKAAPLEFGTKEDMKMGMSMGPLRKNCERRVFFVLAIYSTRKCQEFTTCYNLNVSL